MSSVDGWSASAGRGTRPGFERHVGRPLDGRHRGRVGQLVRVGEQHLQRAGDGADERAGQRGRAHLVELVGERRGQVPGDLALRVELDLQRPARVPPAPSG